MEVAHDEAKKLDSQHLGVSPSQQALLLPVLDVASQQRNDRFRAGSEKRGRQIGKALRLRDHCTKDIAAFGIRKYGQELLANGVQASLRFQMGDIHGEKIVELIAADFLNACSKQPLFTAVIAVERCLRPANASQNIVEAYRIVAAFQK